MAPAMSLSRRSQKHARKDYQCECGQIRPWANTCHAFHIMRRGPCNKHTAQGRVRRPSLNESAEHATRRNVNLASRIATPSPNG
jgi:hypothetical protein